MSSSEEAKLTREDIDEQNRDEFAKTLMKLFEPMVKQLDQQVAATKQSQNELAQVIDALTSDLRTISENHEYPYDMQPYVVKLNESRKRVAVSTAIVNNVNDRLMKMQKSIEKRVQRHTDSAQTSIADAP